MECIHEWHCPYPVTLPQEGGIAILLPLYCQKCGDVMTKLAPRPEQPKIARAQLIPSADFRRR